MLVGNQRRSPAFRNSQAFGGLSLILSADRGLAWVLPSPLRAHLGVPVFSPFEALESDSGWSFFAFRTDSRSMWIHLAFN